MVNQNTCGAIIKQIHDELEKNANNALRPQGLTMAQVGTLLALKNMPKGQCSLKEMEQILHVAQSTAAGIVVRLEQKGLAEGFGSPEDKRIKMVRITSAGEECCFQAEQSMEETEKKLLSGLTETERGIFYSLLVKVRDSIH